MGWSNNLRNILLGIALGVFLASFCWWIGAQPGIVAAVGILWTVAGATMFYVQRTYEAAKTHEAARSKWGLVNGGAVFVASFAALSVYSNSATDGSLLPLIIVGISLLGYHAGMATVHEQRSSSDGARSTTPVRD